MKHIIKYLAFSFVLVMLFNACNKTDNLPYYANGTATVLTSSVTKVAAAPKDSANSVLVLNWTSPAYATDAKQVKFVIEFDSTGRKFAHSVKVILSGVLTKSFTGLEFNSILYQLGANPGASYPLDVRVTSSYANNNEGYYSNVVNLGSTFSGYVAPVLTSSVATTIPIAATTYSSEAVKFSWTNALYTVNNTSAVGISYILQMDRAGGNFSSPVLQNIPTDSTLMYISLTQKFVNTYLMKAGYPLGSASNLQFRIIATIGGVASSLVSSNVITLSVTPVNKPAVDPPASGTLFIVGSATAGQWQNPVPLPTQQFYKKDSVTYEGVFNLIGGNQYLLLPVNGDWSQKYAVADATVSGIAAGTGGAFQYYNSGGSNIPAPATSGWYRILVDFQQGLYTVTPYTDIFPTNLFIVGDATPDSWNNSNPPVNPVFTQIDAANFQVTLPMTGGKSFLILPVAGSWTNKYAVASSSVPAAGGSFGYNLSTNFNGPANSGTYTVTANFYDFTFTVK